MSPSERLIKQMREQRAVWLDIDERRRVKLLRPRETEQVGFLRAVADGRNELYAELEHVKRFVHDWSGFTEADLVGAAGNSEPLAFTPELWAEVCADSLEITRKVAHKLLDVIVEHRTKAAEDAKN